MCRQPCPHPSRAADLKAAGLRNRFTWYRRVRLPTLTHRPEEAQQQSKAKCCCIGLRVPRLTYLDNCPHRHWHTVGYALLQLGPTLYTMKHPKYRVRVVEMASSGLGSILRIRQVWRYLHQTSIEFMVAVAVRDAACRRCRAACQHIVPPQPHIVDAFGKHKTVEGMVSQSGVLAMANVF